jgi:lipopolysaccharide transport system ATP-binding protein
VTLALELRDVWRRYRLPSAQRPTTLRAALAAGRRGDRAQRWLWALQGVDLRLARGEAMAIIGPNGAGKSTLLRLAGGVGRPDRGEVAARGRVGAMLDLGREFHPDLTGRENAELAAVAAGLTRRGFRERVAEMVAFAGLEDFLDEPLHAYSDGMRARLAFSVLAHVQPDLLLVDEVLAVGDAAFQRRSVERIEVLRSSGTAVLFVSHDLGLVRKVCERAVWLDGGVVREEGEAGPIVRAYLQASAGQERPTASAGMLGPVRIEDRWSAPAPAIQTGDGLTVTTTVDDPTGRAGWLSVLVERCADGLRVVDTSTSLTGGREQLAVAFERLDLAPGRHEVVVALYDHRWQTCLGERRAPLDIRGVGADRAPLAPPHEWRRAAPPEV